MPRLSELSERQPISFRRSILQANYDMVKEILANSFEWFYKQPIPKKLGIIIGMIILAVVGVLFTIFHSYFMDLLVSSARTWREMRGGKILMFVLIFGVSFPPLIGFSALSALTGMIWGISGGWPVLAAASITGSMFSFILFRYVLKERAVELMEKSRKFEAFTMILNDKNALWLLCLIRLCPLPYSLSNGALAAVPGISVPTFVGASVLTSPKLLIHLFIGSKIADLGESQDFATGLVDFASILITATAFSLTTYIIYIKMREKMQELGANATITLDEANFGIEDIDEGNGDDDSMFRDEDFEEDNIIV